MNQNLLNYFQMRQNPAQDQASQIANLSSTATPNEVMRGMQASQPAERVDAPAPYNPFDEGIRKALEASRASLSPTAEQQNRAMRAGMLEFGSALGNMPKERGFFANLGQTGRALAPAIRSIDAIDSVSEAQNLALANQILAYQNQEKEMQRKLEEDAWHREFKEKELEERRQNHLLHNFMRRSAMVNSPQAENVLSSDNQPYDPNFAYVEGMPFRKLDKIGMRHAEEEKRETAKANHDIQELYKTWNKLEDKTKDNFFSPLGGWSGITNAAKDFAGKYLGAESLREETALRESLKSQLGQLTLALERAKTGKGVTQGMYDRLKNYYPHENDNTETLKMKLSNIKEDADLFAEAASLSAQYGANITIEDVKRLREMRSNKHEEDVTNEVQPYPAMEAPEAKITQPGYRWMSDPDTGESRQIPESQVQMGIQKGLVLDE